MNYAVLGLLWGVIKFVLKNPLVSTALDNWTNGTSNQIDDWIWDLLKKAAGITDETVRVAFLNNELEILQNKYEWAKTAGITSDLKTPVKSWDSAQVILDDSPLSGNIA